VQKNTKKYYFSKSGEANAHPPAPPQMTSLPGAIAKFMRELCI